jgi:hypothetical protein
VELELEHHTTNVVIAPSLEGLLSQPPCRTLSIWDVLDQRHRILQQPSYEYTVVIVMPQWSL